MQISPLEGGRGFVLSLYDFTGEAVLPWAEAGFACLCFDIQHPDWAGAVPTVFPGGGYILKVAVDLWDWSNLAEIARNFRGRVAFMSSFPVCTDMAVSGAKHFAAKAKADPLFQVKAARRAAWCGRLGDMLGCSWYAENPVSVLSSLWRRPDYTFDPYEYGGYIPEDRAAHPRWPEYLPARDCYTKKTCIWAGRGFVMPDRRPIPLPDDYRGSLIWAKLGGRSDKTKNIRSATPRGFARAVFEANSPRLARPVESRFGV